MDWEHVLSWALQGMISGGIMIGVSELRKIRESVSTLNERVAVVVEKTSIHERLFEKNDSRFERHDERLRRLEVNS